ERLVATGQISREEARHHPQRNVIYRTIGDKSNVEMDTWQVQLRPGDSLLLCSDGLSGMINDETIYQIVTNAPSPQAACDQLVAAANQAGGDDNITAVLVCIAATA
ncbi:MAG: serine/threonine-protein phosphatase, partial [Anaerolineales bacterium]|nr:serine/threonine-protein phosphatase [Anaerolineales bacterium]